MRTKENGSREHPNRIIQTVLAPTLLASSLVGIWIVANDGWLRAVAPSHAYGLLAFAALDVILAFVVIVVPKLGYEGALLVSMTQVIAMLGDALTFAPVGTLQAGFRAYLLGDSAFVALVGIQLAVAGITAAGIAMPHAIRHRFHFDRIRHHKMLP